MNRYTELDDILHEHVCWHWTSRSSVKLRGQGHMVFSCYSVCM